MTLRQLFDGLGSGDRSAGGGWNPPVDIYETEGEVVVVVEAAGVDPASFKVIVDGDVVRVFGSRQGVSQQRGATFHRMEIHTGSFARSFRISVPFSSNGVRATASDGMLSVHLPKISMGRKISIEQA